MPFTAVLPQLIVEAALTTTNPVSGAGTMTLDDPSFGLLDTDFLAGADTWTNITQWVKGFTITRFSTRVQGPLYQWQPGTATITLDNTDGRFDPDNSSSPYAGQIHAMVPVRIRAAYNGVNYPLFRGFADGWQEPQITFANQPPYWTLSATDGLKALSNILLPTISAAGANELTGARVNRILNSAGWYTGQGAGARKVDAGDSQLQATTYGDYALNLLQIAADSEIGEIYIDGSGAFVFRARQAYVTDSRSTTSNAIFGDSPGTFYPNVNGLINNQLVSPTSDFEGGDGTWTGAGNCSLANVNTVGDNSPSSMSMTSGAAGNMTAASSTAGRILQNGVTCTPGATCQVSAYTLAATVTESFQVGCGFYDNTGTFISSLYGPSVVNSTTQWTQAVSNIIAPANAAVFRVLVEVLGTNAANEVHYVDNVAGGMVGTFELPCATIARLDDDTTIANDIQAQIVGSSNLQEVMNQASITEYLFPRTYNRTDLILTTDQQALNWANWVLYVSAFGEDRFDSITVDPQYQPDDLWPQVLGREIGDRVTGVRRPLNVPSPVTRDGFISAITHTWDTASSTWSTTWSLMDATKYGSFLILDNAINGQLDNNALAF